MSPILLTLYGPFAVHAYGVCIAFGVSIALLLILRDKTLKKTVSTDALINALQLMILAGYIGGRMGFLLSEAQTWSDYLMLLKFWEPGLSILGCIMGAFAITSSYLYIKKIPVLCFFDRIAIYAPLAQSFGRIGCFFAGCCYGITSNSWYAITYTHPDHMAPLHMALHPAQLYSSFTLFLIFLLLYFVAQKKITTPGVLLCSYFVLAGLERFLIDFVRWDRLYFNNHAFAYFSIHQWIGLCVSACACIAIFFLRQQSKKFHGSV